MYSFCLADSVWSVLSLLVHSWVPIGVKEDHTVSTGQVDTNTTASGAAYEAEKLGGEVKPVDHLLAGLNFDRTVQSDVRIPVQIQELLQNVQHPSHLGEDQNFGAFKVQRF